MPKLLVFLPCERVVIGREGDNSASIIAIVQGFTAEGSEIPRAPDGPGAPVVAIPVSWSIFALWDGAPVDGDLQARTELFSPYGRSLFKLDVAWRFEEGKRFHRLLSKVPAFPLDGVGEYILKHSLKVGEGDFIEHASFPIPLASVNSAPAAEPTPSP